MKLLLISNSTLAGQPFLDYPKHEIANFLGKEIKKTLFIPYAAVTFTFDNYEKKVQERFSELGYTVDSIHKYSNPVEAVNQAEAIVVGGGNTWQLTKMLQDNNLIEPIRQKVLNGTPFVGWSAGANVACPTIRTTNDMPIIEPQSFNALGFVPFQINPHYLDANPVGHAGETREARIEEFIEVNKHVFVVGLREGSMLKVIDNNIELIGNHTLRIFKYGTPAYECDKNADLNFLLKNYDV